MYEPLQIQERQDKVTESNKKLRNTGWVPGVLYCAGEKSVSVKVAVKTLKKALASGHQIFETTLGKNKHLVNIDEIQKDPLGTKYVHVNFHKLRKDKEAGFNIPIHMINNLNAPGTLTGGVVTLLNDSIHVWGLPENMPDFIEVDCSSLNVHDHISAKDLKLPKGIKLKDADAAIELVSCAIPRKVVENITPAAAPVVEGDADVAATAETAATATKAPASNEKSDKKAA
jgi:large subunit ribosomal protein L25